MSGLRRARRRWFRWVAEHDDRWSFTLLCVGLALLLRMTISLVWPVAVVLAHAVLEWFALSAAADEADADEREEVPWRRTWRVGDRLAVGVAAVFALLILWAPLLTDHTVASAVTTLVAELHPWPGR